MTLIELKRLQSLEREVRLMRKDFAAAINAKVQNALMAATIARLIGENDRLRERAGMAKVDAVGWWGRCSRAG
jgi:hypothetical protein